MLDLTTLFNETRIRRPHDSTVSSRDGKRHVEIRDPRISVTMPTPGGELVLFFEPPLPDGTAPYGAFNELRLIPSPEPWRLMPRLPLYLNYAKAVQSMQEGDLAASLRALRDAGSGVRGHGDDFYRGVASMYDAFVAAGEPSPIKAIAESQPVTISAASKWVKRARDLGFISTELST